MSITSVFAPLHLQGWRHARRNENIVASSNHKWIENAAGRLYYHTAQWPFIYFVVRRVKGGKERGDVIKNILLSKQRRGFHVTPRRDRNRSLYPVKWPKFSIVSAVIVFADSVWLQSQQRSPGGQKCLFFISQTETGRIRERGRVVGPERERGRWETEDNEQNKFLLLLLKSEADEQLTKLAEQLMQWEHPQWRLNCFLR